MDGIEYSQQKNKSQKVMMQVKSRDGIGEGNERKQLTIYATLVQKKKKENNQNLGLCLCIW